MSSDNWRALGLISIYTALLFFLIGWAGSKKMQFNYRAEIATIGYYTAGALVALGVILFLMSFRGKRN